jgi:tetratricopeptide (TPR) repeat protein
MSEGGHIAVMSRFLPGFLPLLTIAALAAAASILPLPLSVPTAHAAADATRAADFSEKQGARLDALFAELKRAADPAAADRIAQKIWNEWGDSGSDSINLLMLWAQRAIGARNFPAALDLLDQVVLLAPDFAEGWNRRATLHFMMENPAKSMADIERTLMLEPRHFGALSGMAEILRAGSDDALALKAYERALDVYPMMRNAQQAAGDLADELAGDRM